MTTQPLSSELQRIFNYLHANPEKSWHEFGTTQYIASYIKVMGLEPITFNDLTGLYVDIGSGSPVVGLRTDIDALWQEVDGVLQANHSCGHDGHMTMALGALKALQTKHQPEHGTIRVLFQPAEEKGTGALAFVEKGIVDTIDYLYGVHVRPVQELKNGQHSPALYHGAARLITGVIHGVEAHGARPHLGKNAIEIGTDLAIGLRTIHIDPMIPTSIKLTSFHAGGEAANVIPGKATFSIDLRSQTNEGIDEAMAQLKTIIEGVEHKYHATIHYQIDANIAAAEVSEEAKSFMQQAIIETVGAENLAPPVVTPGGEDFHFYTLKRPQIKATMLGLGCDLQPGLHHPNMTFNTNQLQQGVEILTRTVLNTFAAIQKEVLVK